MWLVLVYVFHSICIYMPTDRTPSMSTFDSIEMGRGWDEDSNKDPDDRVPGMLLV